MTVEDEVEARLAADVIPINGEEPLDASSPSWLQWQPVDLGSILSGELQAPEPTVGGREDGVRLFYPGRRNMVLGESESLKSWLLDVACCQEIAAGRHVVYLDYEDTPHGLVERLVALGAAAEKVERLVTYYDAPPRLDDVAAELLREHFGGRGTPSLVVVDGVTEAMTSSGLDPDRGVDVAAFYAGTPKWFALTGAAVTMIDHVTKDRESRGRWAIGSERKISGLDGAAYAVELLQPFGRGRIGKAKITISKDRCGYVRQHEAPGRVIAMFELRSWPDGGVTYSLSAPSSTDGTFRPTYLMEKVSRSIELHAGLSKNALRQAVGGKAANVDLALELLIAEEFVAVERGQRGAHEHRSLRPFRDAPEPSEEELS